ncbi:hypothetical protein [Microbacterium sp. 3J1]|uniref:hypothetical protein n=1 Tax=Microbacterium sp. 3J1 TaxID=861269 RepID=UPI000A8EDA07|nr:hypothetical protein [Microbacterium sp. 3J1]
MSTRIRPAAKKAAKGARSRGASRPKGLWVEVEPGFFVGNDRRQFLGSVDGTSGDGFDACGSRAEFLGRYDDLDAAKAAVIAASGAVRIEGGALLA